MPPEKMDRFQISIKKRDEFDFQDSEYWKHASIAEKLQTITYLRECFYGENATSRHPSDARRLLRIHTMLKLK